MTGADDLRFLGVSSTKQPIKDRGYAWIILMASLITLSINWGLILCFGIYFVTFLEHFQCRNRDVAAVGSLAYGILCCSGPLVSYLSKRYGIRPVVMTGSLIASFGMACTYLATSIWHLYITFGLIAGFGCSLMYIPCFAILPQYFDRYQHFATSFATVGSAMGNMILANVLYYTIEFYTWRGSMLINAALLLQVIVCGALMRENKTKGDHALINRQNFLQHQELDFRKQKISPPQSLTNRNEKKNLFKDMKYLMFLVECFCYGASSYTVFALINELIIKHGLTMADSAIILSIIGVFNIAGRVSASLITHCRCTDRPLFFALATAFFTLSIFTTTMCYDFLTFAISLGIFGLTHGVKTSQIAAVLIDLFGIERMTRGMAYGIMCSGLGGLVAPPLAGWLGDVFSLESSFLLAAGFSCVALGSCVTIVFLHRNQIQKNSQCHFESDTTETSTGPKTVF